MIRLNQLLLRPLLLAFNFLVFNLIFLVILGGQLCADPSEVYETRYYSKQEALTKSFGDAVQFNDDSVTLNSVQKESIEAALGWKLEESSIQITRVLQDETLMGYGIVLNEKGKYNPITFLVAISNEFMIKDVIVMVYREKIGSEVRKKRFLKQFFKKTSNDPIMVDYDIMGISGATISSWTLASGVKKALVIVESLFMISSQGV